MQYQLIDRDGNVVAWLDTATAQQIVHNDYTILSGDHLTAVEVGGNLKPKIEIVMK